MCTDFEQWVILSLGKNKWMNEWNEICSQEGNSFSLLREGVRGTNTVVMFFYSFCLLFKAGWHAKAGRLHEGVPWNHLFSADSLSILTLGLEGGTMLYSPWGYIKPWHCDRLSWIYMKQYGVYFIHHPHSSLRRDSNSYRPNHSLTN